MKREKWIPVPGFEGWYEVSDCGGVRSVDREINDRWGGPRKTEGQLISGGWTRDGYRRVLLRRNGERRSVTVHTLVLEAFVGIRPDGMQCRHLNGMKTDNRIENLVWGTHRENIEDRARHGGDASGEDSANAVLTNEQVRSIVRSVGMGKTYRSVAVDFGVSMSTVGMIMTGRNWSSVTGIRCPQSHGGAE